MFGALYMYISALDILFGAWQNEKILHQTTGVPDITHSWLQSILWPFLTFLFLDLKMDPFLQMMKFIFHLLSIRFPYIWKHVCEKQKVFAYGVLSHLLNSSFFWNWCNVNPDKITKSNQLWLKEFVLIIHNPFLMVFAIPAFLKVIHAPKTPNFRYPENNLPT